MDTAPLTPLQQSAADTGRRYFAAPPAVYAALSTAIDDARGYPQGDGTAAVTERGLPLPESLPAAPDGRLLISVETWRVTEGDEAMIAPAIQAGHLTELTAADFAKLMPVPKNPLTPIPPAIPT